MFTSRHVRSITLTIATTGLAAAGGLVGCSNGLVTSSEPGQGPSLDTPAATASASPTVTPSPATDPTPTEDPSESATTGGTEEPSAVPSPASSTTAKEEEPSRSTDPPSSQGTGSDPAPAPSQTTDGADETSAASVTGCTTDDLELGVEHADGGGAAGSSYVVITYTNSSDEPCSLRGYAGVSLVGNDDGTQLGAAAERAPGDIRTITLIPDDHDSELVQIADAGNFEDSECAPTTADGLRIYPPGSRDAAYVPFEVQACQGEDVQQLQVFPVGTSG